MSRARCIYYGNPKGNYSNRANIFSDYFPDNFSNRQFCLNDCKPKEVIVYIMFVAVLIVVLTLFYNGNLKSGFSSNDRKNTRSWNNVRSTMYDRHRSRSLLKYRSCQVTKKLRFWTIDRTIEDMIVARILARILARIVARIVDFIKIVRKREAI